MRALILAGGAAKNAYQIGILQYLLGNLEVKYDLIIGVSSGAILGSFLGQFKHGEEKIAVAELTKLWKGISTKDVCKSWRPLGRIQALWKHGLFDNSNIFKIIKNNVSLDRIRASGKTVCVNVVSMSDAQHYTISQTDDDFLDFVVASSAYPGIFPPVKIKDHFYIDGGTKDLVNTQHAIDMGATQIDILLTSPNKIEKTKFVINLFNIVQRVLDISSDKIISSDLDRLLSYNELAGSGMNNKERIKLNIIRPNDILLKNSFKWDAAKTSELIQAGYQDAIQQYKIFE